MTVTADTETIDNTFKMSYWIANLFLELLQLDFVSFQMFFNLFT